MITGLLLLLKHSMSNAENSLAILYTEILGPLPDCWI